MAAIKQVEEWRRLQYSIAWNARIQLGGETPPAPDLMPYAFEYKPEPQPVKQPTDIGKRAMHANMKAHIRQMNKGKSYG